MKYKFIFVISLVLPLINIAAQAKNNYKITEDENKITDGFHYFKFTDSDKQVMLFRLFIPKNYKKEILYPLILHFHGAGTRGDDNTKQIYLAKIFTAGNVQESHPSFILACQCPADKIWMNDHWTEEQNFSIDMTSEMQMVVKIFNYILQTYSIDKAMLYVYGQSMGGFATWEIITRYPDLFAAAIPVCGGGDEYMAKKIAHIPIWAFHGYLDPTVRVEQSRNMIEAIKNAGGNPKYTEYPDVKHDAWNYAYKEPDLIEWLFSQKKNKKLLTK